MENFSKKFHFRKDGKLAVGVERECFLTDLAGNIMPISVKVLEFLVDRSQFGFELSACQLETRVGPVHIEGLAVSLYANDMILRWAETMLGFRQNFSEVGPPDMPLDVYPDPTGRYQKIVKNMPRHILSAACRVIGTHVHVGMPDKETALRVYNKVIKKVDKLCEMGDGSGGERLKIYKVMAPDFSPPKYGSWKAFYTEAVKKGFVEDPRKCWHLIRISVHGTIEFRMFGATEDVEKIVSWARVCHKLCEDAMKA